MDLTENTEMGCFYILPLYLVGHLNEFNDQYLTELSGSSGQVPITPVGGYIRFPTRTSRKNVEYHLHIIKIPSYIRVESESHFIVAVKIILIAWLQHACCGRYGAFQHPPYI